MRFAICAALTGCLTLASSAHAKRPPMRAPLIERDPERVRVEGTDAPRLGVAIGYGAFGDAGKSIGRHGPTAIVSLPVFFGARRKVFQWALSIDAETTWDAREGLARVGVGPMPQARINIGSVYAFHLGIGALGLAQLGRSRSLGVAMVNMSIENVFRPFADDRMRLYVGFRVAPGIWFRNDPGNDCPGCGFGASAYVGFETPL